ncbi:MAG: YlmC/YmxH family sporulation protein [Clostridiales bacterium]|nr:YlmC/YmxH family sporulation protein [Clostridiales bacterium]
MVRIYEMRQKEVINVRDGCRLGYICDIEVNTKTGKIEKIIIPAPGKIFGIFGREEEYRIPWSAIKQIGDDLILVDVEAEKIMTDGDSEDEAAELL